MKYLSRIIENKVRDIGKYFQVVVVTGARQVGKSTLFEHLHLTHSDPIVFDPVLDVRNARQDPDLFLRNISLPAVLDEIQYAPELISAIKRFVDQRKDQKGLFYLTGSQQFSVIKNISESLAGRAVYLELLPFCLAEKYEQSHYQLLIEIICNSAGKSPLGKGTPLSKIVFHSQPLFQTLWRGFYPGTTEIPDNYFPAWYESYLHTYIERDIRILGEIRDEHLFSRFFQLLSALTAQEINYSQVGRELGIDPKTAQAWLTMLERSYQWISIPAYCSNMVKRISCKPKGYLTDTGFICYLQRIGSADVLAGHPLLGPIFESFVICEIIKHTQRMLVRPNFYHWKAHSGAEVDLIIEFNGLFHLIEVKLKTNPTLKDTQGFSSFRKTYQNLSYGCNWIICAAEEAYQLQESTFVLPYDYLVA